MLIFFTGRETAWKKGSSLSGLEGIVGTQGMGLYGGAHQVYIDYRAVPSDWIEISPIILEVREL